MTDEEQELYDRLYEAIHDAVAYDKFVHTDELSAADLVSRIKQTIGLAFPTPQYRIIDNTTDEERHQRISNITVIVERPVPYITLNFVVNKDKSDASQ